MTRQVAAKVINVASGIESTASLGLSGLGRNVKLAVLRVANMRGEPQITKVVARSRGGA
jgi:hypothetical protein